MFRLKADSEAAFLRFVDRVLVSEVVWYIGDESEIARCDSREQQGVSVVPVWSDRAYAQRCIAHFTKMQLYEVALARFVDSWLPGMTEDGLILGPNWDQKLAGKEIGPGAMREAIEAARSK